MQRGERACACEGRARTHPPARQRCGAVPAGASWPHGEHSCCGDRESSKVAGARSIQRRCQSYSPAHSPVIVAAKIGQVGSAARGGAGAGAAAVAGSQLTWTAHRRLRPLFPISKARSKRAPLSTTSRHANERVGQACCALPQSLPPRSEAVRRWGVSARVPSAGRHCAPLRAVCQYRPRRPARRLCR